MGMIVHLTESLAQAKRLREQDASERGHADERLQDSREALVDYQILLAQLKETLARG
jgi:hypothetical protein